MCLRRSSLFFRVAASSSYSFVTSPMPLTMLEADTAVRDILFRELRPHQYRIDVPVIASMVSDRVDERAIWSGASNVEHYDRRTLHFQCPHSMRLVLAYVGNASTRAMVAAEPSLVLGFDVDYVTSSTSSDAEHKMSKTLFDAQNASVPVRELYTRVVREIVLPILKQRVVREAEDRGGGGNLPSLGVSILDLMKLSGWHRFAHLMVEFTSLQDALLQTGEVALASDGHVVPVDAEIWATVIRRHSPSCNEGIPLKQLFFGSALAIKKRFNTRFLPPSLAKVLLDPESELCKELKGKHGFEIRQKDLSVHKIIR